MAAIVEGEISVLACESCRLTFPHFVFSGDTDMVTAGLMTCSSATANEVVLGDGTAEEWRDQSGTEFAKRANTALARADLKPVQLLGTIDDTPAAGLSFQEFRRRYQSPTLQYRCSWCGGRAEVRRGLRPRAFEQGGGTITLLDGLRLRDHR